ncbi:MAG: T9SS type A sorting domain-containing protein [Candidatus Cloacimonetes bacterium]|nr:T9SS type A sorting domain-containing protein [Candidatus Cloacimonadota bacterium]
MWGDGVTVYKGNYIYYLESVENDDDTISVIWSESDETTRSVKYQKLSPDGTPILLEPATVYSSEIDLQNGELAKSSDGNLFTILYECTETTWDVPYLTKLDTNGSIIWSAIIENSLFASIYPDDQGGCFLIGNGVYHYSTDGSLEWYTPYELTLNSYKAVTLENSLYFFYPENGYCYLQKILINGESGWDQPLFIGEVYSFWNGSAITVFNDTLFLAWKASYTSTYIQTIDQEGNLLNDDPLFEESFEYNPQFVMVDDELFLTSRSDNEFYLAKINEYGNVTDYNSYVFPYSNIVVESDLVINISGDYENYTYHIYDINEQGINIEEPLIVTQNPLQRPRVLEKNENHITIISKLSVNNVKGLYSTVYNTDGSPSGTHLITKSLDTISQTAQYQNEQGLSMFWRPYYDSGNICRNFISFNGEVSFPTEGEIAITSTDELYIRDLIHHNQFNYTISYDYESYSQNNFITVYDTDFNPISSFPLFENPPLCIYGHKFTVYQDEVYCLIHYQDIETGLNNKLMINKIGENGFAWENPIIIENTHYRISHQNFILTHESDSLIHSLYCFDAEGNCQVKQLSVDYEYHNLTQSINTLYFFSTDEIIALDQNLNCLWEEPLYVNSNEITHISNDENFIYVIANIDNEHRFYQYDHNKNLVASILISGYNGSIRIRDLGNAFIIFKTDYNDMILKYTILSKTGEIIENENVLSNLNGRQVYENSFVVGNDIYVFFRVEFQHQNEYVETNYYLQKIDISDFVNTDDNIVLPVAEFSVNAYPNPFNPNLTISYTLPAESDITIDIYNLKGQKVTNLIREKQISGPNYVLWNGKDSNDRSVSSGMYFYRIKAGTLEKTGKVMLLK